MNKCPMCNSEEIKVKYTLIICHDCGHLIERYGIKEEEDEEDNE